MNMYQIVIPGQECQLFLSCGHTRDQAIESFRNTHAEFLYMEGIEAHLQTLDNTLRLQELIK